MSTRPSMRPVEQRESSALTTLPARFDGWCRTPARGAFRSKPLAAWSINYPAPSIGPSPRSNPTSIALRQRPDASAVLLVAAAAVDFGDGPLARLARLGRDRRPANGPPARLSLAPAGDLRRQLHRGRGGQDPRRDR